MLCCCSKYSCFKKFKTQIYQRKKLLVGNLLEGIFVALRVLGVAVNFGTTESHHLSWIQDMVSSFKELYQAF